MRKGSKWLTVALTENGADRSTARAVVGSPTGEQSGQRPDHEGQEEGHRGIVEEPLALARIGVSDPHGIGGRSGVAWCAALPSLIGRTGPEGRVSVGRGRARRPDSATGSLQAGRCVVNDAPATE